MPGRLPLSSLQSLLKSAKCALRDQIGAKMYCGCTVRKRGDLVHGSSSVVPFCVSIPSQSFCSQRTHGLDARCSNHGLRSGI